MPGKFVTFSGLLVLLALAGQARGDFICPETDVLTTGCKGPKDCLYANPDNCESFIQCVPQPPAGLTANPVVQPCPADVPEWNDCSKQCDFPGSGTCNGEACPGVNANINLGGTSTSVSTSNLLGRKLSAV